MEHLGRAEFKIWSWGGKCKDSTENPTDIQAQERKLRQVSEDLGVAGQKPESLSKLL